MNTEKKKNIPKISIGYRVGKLTVSEPTEERKCDYVIWKCSCDCAGTNVWRSVLG